MKDSMCVSMSFKVSRTESKALRLLAKREGKRLSRYLRLKVLKDGGLPTIQQERPRKRELNQSIKNIRDELKIIEALIQ